MATKTKAQKLNQERDKAANLAKLRRGKDTSNAVKAAMVPADKPLTDMQVKFVQSWAQGDSIPNAMARAGYNEQPAYGYRMAKMPNILALYRAEKELYEQASQMTRKKVMDGILEGIEMGKLMSEGTTVIAGWREIAKMCGYYEPQKRELNINLNGQIAMQRMTNMTDAQLLEMIQKGVAEAAQLRLADESEDEEEEQP